MLSVIIVTHGDLATEFVKAAEHVLGKKSHFQAFCIYPQDDVEQKRLDLIELVEAQAEKVGKGYKGTVVLTDMFGGTPSNLSLSLLDHAGVEVVAGVNLPMLIKLLTVRDRESLDTAAQMAQETGRQYMNVARQFLQKTA